MRTGAAHATGDFLVFLDADGTYPPEAIPRLLALLQEGRVDIAVGSRFLEHGAQLSWPRRIGNRTLTWLARHLYVPTTAFCSGLYAMPRQLWLRLEPTSVGFEIEPELFIE